MVAQMAAMMAHHWVAMRAARMVEQRERCLVVNSVEPMVVMLDPHLVGNSVGQTERRKAASMAAHWADCWAVQMVAQLVPRKAAH